MQYSCLSARSCAVVLTLSLATAGMCRAQSYVHIESDLARGARERIERALSEVTSISCVDKPLSELLDDLSRQMGVPIVIRRSALEDAAVHDQEPITSRLDGVSYRSTLRLVLSELDLTWIIRDEVLVVTTVDDAESDLETRLYPVLDLVALEGNTVDEAARGEHDYDTLIESITTTVEPDSWDEVGGPGTIADIPNAAALVITQTQEVHERVERVLSSLRRVRELQGITALPMSSVASKRIVGQRPLDSAPSRRFSSASAPSWQLPRVHGAE